MNKKEELIEFVDGIISGGCDRDKVIKEFSEKLDEFEEETIDTSYGACF